MLLLGSCKKYLDVNQNVNQPTAVTPSVVLSSALVGSAQNVSQDFLNLARWMGYWSRSGNYVPDVQTETYAIPNNYTDAEWANIYGTLNRYNYIMTTANAEHLPFYQGVAKVMSAYHFATLVDIYNNVPYSDAFNVATSVQPKYDDAQTIYNTLVTNIDSAVYFFDSAAIYYATAASVERSTDDQYDLMFGNSGSNSVSNATARMDMWVKFANTLKLKLLIHQSEVASQLPFITSELLITKNNGRGYLGANENAKVNPGYSNSSGKISPFFSNFYTVTGTTNSLAYYRANSVALNAYSPDDSRIDYFYSPYSGSSFGGNFDGDPASVSNSATSPVGSGLTKGPAQNVLLLSDFESLFLQAEAAQRGWIDGDAKSFYEEAVTQNFVYLYKDGTNTLDPSLHPVADAQLVLTSGNPNYDWSVSTNKINTIITQKWIANNGTDWVESWDDYRRLGIPDLPISAAPTHVQPQIPVRYLYPQSEYNTNAANTPVLPANAQFTAKVFWDVN